MMGLIRSRPGSLSLYRATPRVKGHTSVRTSSFSPSARAFIPAHTPTPRAMAVSGRLSLTGSLRRERAM